MNQYGHQGPGWGPTPPGAYGQPQYGQPQYGQPQYGQPQYGQPQYGQPQYAQPQYAHDPRVAKLESEANTWLLVGIIGFWVGMSWVSGPLAWIMAGRVRSQYLALGMAPSSTATAAWVIGIISTVLTVLTVLAVFMLITVVGGMLWL